MNSKYHTSLQYTLMALRLEDRAIERWLITGTLNKSAERVFQHLVYLSHVADALDAPVNWRGEVK